MSRPTPARKPSLPRSFDFFLAGLPITPDHESGVALTDVLSRWRTVMRRFGSSLILVVFAGLTGLSSRAEEPAAGEVILTDLDGKEHKLTAVKLTAGTRRLAWQADPKGTTEDAKKGPLVLAFRELHSTARVDGIVTYIPVTSIESARFDFEKESVLLSVKGITQPLMGELGFPRTNILGLNGMLDGKTALYTGGVRGKPTLKSITFGGAAPVPKRPAGKTWNVQIVQPKAENPTLFIRNLKVLFSYPGGVEELVDAFPIRKGTPIPFDESLKRFEFLADGQNTEYSAAEVETGATPERVVAIPHKLEKDKKVGTLLGFVGEVDAGWKFLPLHAIKVITPSKRKIE
jgi:hypothetical protein